MHTESRLQYDECNMQVACSGPYFVTLNPSVNTDIRATRWALTAPSEGLGLISGALQARSLESRVEVIYPFLHAWRMQRHRRRPTLIQPQEVMYFGLLYDEQTSK